MTINTQMSPQELKDLSYKVDGYNKTLKEDQKIVSKNSLEEADFMKLLITQLKTQDPTNPMNDKEFMGQMAQMTSLKQMNQMADNMKNFTKDFTFSKAVGLVNKTVSWVDDNGGMKDGVVESIKVRNGDTFLKVDGNEITINQLSEVRDPLPVQKIVSVETEKTSAKPDIKADTKIDKDVKASKLPNLEDFRATRF